jgi:hypothetical protein
MMAPSQPESCAKRLSEFNDTSGTLVIWAPGSRGLFFWYVWCVPPVHGLKLARACCKPLSANVRGCDPTQH